MKRPPLFFFFLLALLALVFGAKLFPPIRLLSFAPFFSILFMRKSFLTSLWIAALCGLLSDLFSIELRLGVSAVCSVGAAAATYHLKHYFYEDNFFSIPLYTAAISAVFSAIQFILVRHLFDFSLLLMPLLDALYGFVWFTCPRMVYSFARRT